MVKPGLPSRQGAVLKGKDAKKDPKAAGKKPPFGGKAAPKKGAKKPYGKK